GGYKSAFNDFAVNIAAERIRDAEAVGAEIIATACPFCVLNLNAGAKKIGSKVKVMDISEILLKVTAPIEASAAVAPAPAPAPAPVPEVVKEVPKPVVVEEPPPAPVPEVGEWDDLILDTPESRLRRILWKRGYRYRRNYGDDKITIAYPKPLAAIFVSDERDPETDLRLMDQKWSLIRFINSEMSDDSEKEAQIVIDLLNRRDAGAAAEAAKFAEPEPIPEPTEEAEEEMELDTPEYRLRRILWRRGYRYRRNYGDDNITIAYPNSDVAVFVSKDPDYGTDLRLIDKGWSLLRFYEADMTDSEKEAEIVIDLLNRRDAAAAAAAAKAVPKATPVPAEEEEDNDIFAEETPQDSADLKLRRRLWRRGYRYRKQYGDEKMNVAYLKAKVCAFVSKKDDNRTDDALRGEGWTVLRFREADVTDAVKEADAVIAAIEDSFDAHCAEYLTAAAEEHDDDVLADEMPSDCADLKIRRILWRRGYRYRKHYGKDDITIAFLKAKVAAFVGPEAKNRDTDDGLKKEGWNVLRFKDADVTDGKKEAERIITAIEKSLNSMMNEDLPAKGKVKVDEDVLKEEKADDPADLKLRRLLWWGGYRYRRKYGREKITVAFRRAKVGAFVSADAHRRKGDDQLVKRGWTVMRFRESNITDAKKEAAKVIAAVDRNLYLLSKGIIPEGANITCTDVLDRDVEENTPEYRLRMALWPTNRYRKNFGEENIDIAYPGSKVAVFVSDTTDRKPCDDRLEEDNWAVLRFKGVNITDGKKEAEKVIAAIEKNKKLVDAMESEKYDVDNMDDLAYLLEDTPELRVRRAVWKKKLRYRRNYSRYKIHMAFVKWQVAAFIDTDPKKRPVDDTLTSKGWIVLRFRESGITDGKKEAEQIFEAVKENKKLLKKPKKKPAKKKE
ncbi:MAG: heterodisulfide reductase-related iron-sulfur binding cluster, partial [Methanomassiliicoccaceae archaeon]|nr:heterodisulfide reductase-related iron-sulfur binding cluster [Methanomassiliicoccaceae archaeon]